MTQAKLDHVDRLRVAQLAQAGVEKKTIASVFDISIPYVRELTRGNGNYDGKGI